MRYSASKYSVTLKTGLWVVQDHCMKMAPFVDHNTTFYLSAIFELFDVEWYHDLEIWVRGHSRSFKLVPFQSLSAVSYWPSIVTMALSCIICEIDRDIGQKSWFFIPPCIRHSRSGGSRRNIAIPWYRKTIMVGLPDGEKTLRICVIV